MNYADDHTVIIHSDINQFFFGCSNYKYCCQLYNMLDFVSVDTTDDCVNRH